MNRKTPDPHGIEQYVFTYILVSVETDMTGDPIHRFTFPDFFDTYRNADDTGKIIADGLTEKTGIPFTHDVDMMTTDDFATLQRVARRVDTIRSAYAGIM